MAKPPFVNSQPRLWGPPRPVPPSLCAESAPGAGETAQLLLAEDVTGCHSPFPLLRHALSPRVFPGSCWIICIRHDAASGPCLSKSIRGSLPREIPGVIDQPSLGDGHGQRSQAAHGAAGTARGAPAPPARPSVAHRGGNSWEAAGKEPPVCG